MARKIKWVEKNFKTIKLKLDTNTFHRFKILVAQKETTFQEHLEDCVIKELNKKAGNNRR